MLSTETQALIYSQALISYTLERTSYNTCEINAKMFADNVLMNTLNKFKDEPKVYVNKRELLLEVNKFLKT